MVEIYYETWGVHWCNKKICDLEYEWVDFLPKKTQKTLPVEHFWPGDFFSSHLVKL